MRHGFDAYLRPGDLDFEDVFTESWASDLSRSIPPDSHRVIGLLENLSKLFLRELGQLRVEALQSFLFFRTGICFGDDGDCGDTACISLTRDLCRVSCAQFGCPGESKASDSFQDRTFPRALIPHND